MSVVSATIIIDKRKGLTMDYEDYEADKEYAMEIYWESKEL
jgi:hypothetical protein